MKCLGLALVFATLAQFVHGKELFSENATSPEVSPRIVRGEEARDGMFPFMVAIYRLSSYICSGFIVSKTTILSAAHCFYRGGSLEDAAFFHAAAGSVDRSGQGASLRFKSIHPHPKYRTDREKLFPYENDLAALKTRTEIPFSDGMKRVCIANWSSRYTKYKSALALGWGSTGTDGKSEFPSVLNYSDLKILSPIFCPSIDFGDRSKICAFTPRTGICQGDSGGALVHWGPDPVVIGIASHIHSGRGCGRLPSFSVFTRIASYNSFVRRHSGDICEA